MQKSPMNYIGNKYRIINRLEEIFPREISLFVDIFCGGCDVSINTKASHIISNDINYHLIEIYRAFQSNDIDDILSYIDGKIAEWQLSKENSRGYIAFRDFYNKTQNPLDLYVLMCYSFNYQFRFNSNHEYNNPFGRGRSSFNAVMRKNFIKFHESIKNIEFTARSFENFDYGKLQADDFIYADPPYLLTCGSYNDGKRGFKGWTSADDARLFSILDELNEKNVRFALSNVTEHKGQTNDMLIKWAKKNNYRLHDVTVDYNNCNYHTENGKFLTREVVITNY